MKAWHSRLVWWGLALGTCLVAFALRVHALGLPNLTGDEWFMLRNHDEGPVWIIHQAHTFEPHPLLYYLGLAGWIELAGRSEFAMRFPSVVFGVMLVAALIGLGRTFLGRWGGILAGVLAAVNAYQISESQNARNYAMVVALSAVASLLFVRALRRRRRGDYVAYGVAMLLALNTHYDAALVLAVHVVYVATRSIWHRLRHDDESWTYPGRAWFVTTAVVSIVFGSWLLYALPALLAYHGYFPTPVGIDRVLSRSLATFSLGSSASVHAALPMFGLALIGLAWLVFRRANTALFVGLYTLLPIALVSILFLFRPMFDARYLIVLAPGFLLLLAAGIYGLVRDVWPVGLLVAAGVAFVIWPTVPRTYQVMLTDRANYRGMAAWVSAFGHSHDPIIATGYGQAELFGYYYHGPQPIQILDKPSDISASLPGIVDNHSGVWLLPYWRTPADQAALSLLGRTAALTADKWFSGAQALYYVSPRDLSRSSPAHGDWDESILLRNVALTGGTIDPGDALGARLDWHVGATLPTPKVSLRLIDPGGAIVAQNDLPLSSASKLTVGDLTFRIGLFVPPATPPGAYTATLLLYHPDSGAALHLTDATPSTPDGLVLGQVQIGDRFRSVLPQETGVPLVSPVTFRSGVSLLGHDSLGPARPAGDWLSFRVLWRADRSGLPALQRTIGLVDGHGHVLASSTTPLSPNFPTSKWQSGQLLAERIRFQIPPAVVNGSYHLTISVGSDPKTEARLGRVVVNGPMRVFVRPTFPHIINARLGNFATLLGDALGPTVVKAGDTINLQLYWRADATTPKSYTVFVHLVDSAGKIVGQADHPPVNGKRPTDGWAPGEYLRDDYRIRVAANAPSGSDRIEVGLYDAKSGVRVPVVLANGQKSDHVVVTTVTVGR